MSEPFQFIRRFAELGSDDVALVGGKNSALGEMYQSLHASGVRVPNGFATTASAYRELLDSNRLGARIERALDTLDIEDTRALATTGAQIREWINAAEIPPSVVDEVRCAYRDLCGGETDISVAVRSSATAEDLPQASFAGQQDTHLNIRGIDALLDSIRGVTASLFTNRAIAYREHHGFAHMQVALSCGVQRMVRSDIGAAGVMFTLDTESGFRDAVLITAAYGLGENVVQGTVTPDEFLVYKNTLTSARPILRRHLGDKALRMVFDDRGDTSESTRNEAVADALRAQFAISDDEVIELSRYGMAIEQHFAQRNGIERPMDIEWARDGRDGKLYILQARPETVHAQKSTATQEVYTLKQRGDVYASGQAVGARIGSGRARHIPDAASMHDLQDGEVLVTDITDPDWEPVMKRASAIVTNRGGRTCHAAIVARELGVPAVVGSGDGTRTIPDGERVTVSCAEGRTGYIYAGELPFEHKSTDITTLSTTRTKVMLIVGNPEQAFEFAALPNDGVGLARMEFIISHSIGIHPRALLEYAQQSDELRTQIDTRSRGYPDPVAFYVERLAEGVGTIAAAFHPRPVIVRMSDFKTNEYASLIGGDAYEHHEENPMLGFRGATRYPSEQFGACFALECRAMQRVREDMGLTNVELMLPFVRSPNDADAVLALMREKGLVRGEKNLKVHLMCEIPANAICADDFLTHCDGFSIGSNDLTQLTLGVDRDAEQLGGYDERSPAVLKLMELAIAACKREGKYVGICGQAPSDFPEITRWLVARGIDSIALNPDCAMAMRETIAAAEAESDC